MPLAPCYLDGTPRNRIYTTRETINYQTGRIVPKRWKHINCCTECGKRLVRDDTVVYDDTEADCFFLLCMKCANG